MIGYSVKAEIPLVQEASMVERALAKTEAADRIENGV